MDKLLVIFPSPASYLSSLVVQTIELNFQVFFKYLYRVATQQRSTKAKCIEIFFFEKMMFRFGVLVYFFKIKCSIQIFSDYED